MAEKSTQQAAAKQRIISHMNADHQDSVIRYAEHYCGVSSFVARNALITDLSLNELAIKCSGKQYRVPLDPPMESWRDARERMVKMDKEAVAGLSRSDITLKEYRRPRGFQAVVFGACVLTFILLSREENCHPGSFLYDNLLKHVPKFAGFVSKIRLWVLYPMIAVHLAEAVWMAKSRMQKHSVPVASRLWWTWTISTFLEGFGAFQRVDAVVKEKRMEKEKQKH